MVVAKGSEWHGLIHLLTNLPTRKPQPCSWGPGSDRLLSPKCYISTKPFFLGESDSWWILRCWCIKKVEIHQHPDFSPAKWHNNDCKKHQHGVEALPAAVGSSQTMLKSGKPNGLPRAKLGRFQAKHHPHLFLADDSPLIFKRPVTVCFLKLHL